MERQTPILNKKNLVRGLTAMVKNYANDTITHGIEICKLCRLYYLNNEDIELDKSCGNCLNTIFENVNSNRTPCVYRSEKYPNLDYVNTWNNPNLSKFWQEVLDLVKATKPNEIFDLTDDFKSKFLAIAEKYK